MAIAKMVEITILVILTFWRTQNVKICNFDHFGHF